MAIGSITITVRLEQRAWFKPAFIAAYWACALAALVSDRLAYAISGTSSTLLARYGFRYIFE